MKKTFGHNSFALIHFYTIGILNHNSMFLFLLINVAFSKMTRGKTDNCIYVYVIVETRIFLRDGIKTRQRNN